MRAPSPYGHGEKSVYVINGFVRLTREEAMAIRWHMGFSGTEDNRTVGQAFAKISPGLCPLGGRYGGHLLRGGAVGQTRCMPPVVGRHSAVMFRRPPGGAAPRGSLPL